MTPDYESTRDYLDQRFPRPEHAEPNPQDIDEHRLAAASGEDEDGLDETVTLADVKEAVSDAVRDTQKPEPGPNDYPDEYENPKGVQTALRGAAKRLQAMEQANDADAETFFDAPVSPGAETKAPNTEANAQDTGNVEPDEDEKLRLQEIRQYVAKGEFSDALEIGDDEEIQAALTAVQSEQVATGREGEIAKLRRELDDAYQLGKPHDIDKCERLEQLKSQRAVQNLRKMPFFNQH